MRRKRLTKPTDNPISRFRNWLVDQGWWSEAEDKALLQKNKKEVLSTFNRAEKMPKPKLSEMFNDVWAIGPGEKLPAVITEQRAELGGLLKKYGTTWEPWRKELKRFVEEGEDVMDSFGKSH